MAAVRAEGRDPGLSAGRWRRRVPVCAAVVVGYAVLIGLLVVVIYAEDHQVNVPLLVLCVLGLAVAAVAAITRSRWTPWVALVYSAFTLAADAPHQVPELLHPTSATHTLGAAILLVAGAISVLVALWASLPGWTDRT